MTRNNFHTEFDDWLENDWFTSGETSWEEYVKEEHTAGSSEKEEPTP